MTRDEAIQKLIETRNISTAMLEPLNISFEAWLRFAQIKDDETRNLIIDKTIQFYTETDMNLP